MSDGGVRCGLAESGAHRGDRGADLRVAEVGRTALGGADDPATAASSATAAVTGPSLLSIALATASVSNWAAVT